ncbi:DnaJ domain-containing protein [bacterium]|nr:DnaJ domain-containing protein [bacterium]
MGHYSVLGIPTTASRAEVARAYATKVAELTARQEPEDTPERRAVEVAFSILSNDERRVVYDAERRAGPAGADSRGTPVAPVLPASARRAATAAKRGANELHPDTFDMSAFGKEPDNLGDALVRCEELRERGEAAAAVETLERAVETFCEVEPDWVPRSLLKLGRMLESDLEDAERAAEVYKRLLSAAPGSKEAVRAESALAAMGIDPPERKKAEKTTAKRIQNMGDGLAEVRCSTCSTHYPTSLLSPWSVCVNCGTKNLHDDE